MPCVRVVLSGPYSVATVMAPSAAWASAPHYEPGAKASCCDGGITYSTLSGNGHSGRSAPDVRVLVLHGWDCMQPVGTSAVTVVLLDLRVGCLVLLQEHDILLREMQQGLGRRPGGGVGGEEVP